MIDFSNRIPKEVRNMQDDMGVKGTLVHRLNKADSLICVVGLGYVGLPLALNYVEHNYKVLGIDIDPNKISSLEKGESYINTIDSKRIKNAFSQSLLTLSTKYEEVSKADAVIICVPTPLTKFREPNLTYILNTMKSLTEFIRPGQVISLESTTYPGTTEEELRPIIESIGLNIGSDVFLVYSPEREDPGNAKYETKTIPKVLGGSTKSCQEVGKALYKNIIIEIVEVSNTKVAEMTKLVENIHRCVNIALVNELKPLADRIGIDIYEVIRAASTKPFGFVPYYPGPGLGGHCIPIDPFYLTYKAREYGMNTKFIELSGEVNAAMPTYVLEKTIDALNDINMAVSSSKILILGIAYKKNVDDMRESPSVELINLFLKKGAEVQYSDPYFPVFPNIRKYNFDLSSIELTPSNISDFDAVIIATDHDSFDYPLLLKHSKIVIDTRGRFSTSSKVIRA